MSQLVLVEILEEFVKTLTSDGKYPVQNFDNFLQLPIQMQLCEKRRPFSAVFVSFLDSISNFQNFERKDDRHS